MKARELFAALTALPREAGTPAATAARGLLIAHLTDLGYEVRELRFNFQPSSLNAFPLLGAGLGWLTLLEIPLLLMGNLPGLLAPLVWVAGSLALGMLTWGIGTGAEVPGAERREDANLVATRGSSPIRRWIVAHVDTKAQGHSMAGRLIAVWVMTLAMALMTGLACWRMLRGGALPGSVVGAAAGLSLAAGVLAGRGRLRGTSLGARDNGTGLLAALVAAESCRDDDVGFLFTGAEEFGLVGARAFLREAGTLGAAEVVNLDTLTDRGVLYLVAHNAHGRTLAEELLPAFSHVAPRVMVGRLPLGIMTDSLPLARAGSRAVTLARLDWADLKRLHTARDTTEELGLETAEAVGLAVSSLPRIRR